MLFCFMNNCDKFISCVLLHFNWVILNLWTLFVNLWNQIQSRHFDIHHSNLFAMVCQYGLSACQYRLLYDFREHLSWLRGGKQWNPGWFEKWPSIILRVFPSFYVLQFADKRFFCVGGLGIHLTPTMYFQFFVYKWRDATAFVNFVESFLNISQNGNGRSFLKYILFRRVTC